MFSEIWSKIKEIVTKMIGKTDIEQALHISPIISSDMTNAIELWEDMYKGKAPWLHEPTFDNPTRIVSLGLPAFIASEKARMATLEMKSEITTPQKQERAVEKDAKQMIEDEQNAEHLDSAKVDDEVKISPRVKFLNDTYQEKVLRRLRHNLEYGIALGGMIIKPYVVQLDEPDSKDSNVKARIEVDFVPANNFFPIAFTVNGEITEAAFVQTKVDKDTIYRRLEYHKLEGSRVIIRNKAYMSKNTNTAMNQTGYNSNLGKEIDLKEVPEWKDFEPETIIENVDRLLFGYFKMPDTNTIDPQSPMGISGFGRAIDLIRDADTQYSNLLWEYEATQAAIDIDRDALKPYEDRNGVTHSINLMLQERLFRRLDLGQDDTYNPFIPQIRDESIINGLNTILTRIEDVCALSRGTLSTSNNQTPSTATQLKILRQRSYSVNADIQKELEHTLKNVIYVMNVYCDLYNIVPKAEYEVSYEWDDSILVDASEELTKRVSLMTNGVYSKLELRMWYFGETEEQARYALKVIENENRKSIMQNAKLQQETGIALQTLNNNMKGQQSLNGRDDDETIAKNKKEHDDKSITNKKLKEAEKTQQNE